MKFTFSCRRICSFVLVFAMILPLLTHARPSALAANVPQLVDNTLIEYNEDYDDGVVDVQWGAELFSYPSTMYNNPLALVAASLNAAAGKWATNGYYIEKAYRDLGFPEENIYLYSYPDNPKNKVDVKGVQTTDHELAFSIAHQTMMIQGEETNVIFIVLRGTELDSEATSDYFTKADQEFYPSEGYKVHGYFLKYMDEVWAGLKHYAHQHNGVYTDPNSKISKEKERNIRGNVLEKRNKIVIAGHSLGGAAANLLAAKMNLIEKLDTKEWQGMGFTYTPQKEDIYAYTFGALNAFDKEYPDTKTDFNNIHNIFNHWDTFGPEGEGNQDPLVIPSLTGDIEIGRGEKPASGWKSEKYKFGKMLVFKRNFTDFFTRYGDDKAKNYRNHTMASYIHAVKDMDVLNDENMLMLKPYIAYLVKLKPEQMNRCGIRYGELINALNNPKNGWKVPERDLQVEHSDYEGYYSVRDPLYNIWYDFYDEESATGEWGDMDYLDGEMKTSDDAICYRVSGTLSELIGGMSETPVKPHTFVSRLSQNGFSSSYDQFPDGIRLKFNGYGNDIHFDIMLDDDGLVAPNAFAWFGKADADIESNPSTELSSEEAAEYELHFSMPQQFAAYDEIIMAYAQIARDRDDELLTSRMGLYAGSHYKDDFSYCLFDINRDGTEELIIRANISEEPIILAIYSQADGVPFPLWLINTGNMSRNVISIDASGNLIVRFGGGGLGYERRYRMDMQARRIIFVDGYRTSRVSVGDDYSWPMQIIEGTTVTPVPEEDEEKVRAKYTSSREEDKLKFRSVSDFADERAGSSNGANLLDSMTKAERRAANIFFSNFSESYFDDFNIDNCDETKLIAFALRHIYINRFMDFLFVGDNYLRISPDRVNQVLTRFFGMTIRSMENFSISDSAYPQYYKDGYIYYPDWYNLGDGEPALWSHVTRLVDNGDGTFTADVDTYWGHVDPSGFYGDKGDWPDEEVYHDDSSTAVIRPYRDNNRDTYQLIALYPQGSMPPAAQPVAEFPAIADIGPVDYAKIAGESFTSCSMYAEPYFTSTLIPHEDGSFDGKYSGVTHDFDTGEHDEDYRTTSFRGQFSPLTKISDWEYSMQIDFIEYDSPDDRNTDRLRTIGIALGDQFRLYVPGTDTGSLPQRFVNRLAMQNFDEYVPDNLLGYALYHLADPGAAFSQGKDNLSEEEDSEPSFDFDDSEILDDSSDYAHDEVVEETVDEIRTDASGVWEYKIVDGGAMIIGMDTDTEGELSIPSTLDGYAVTRIGGMGISVKQFESIHIPDSVTRIDYAAFYYCPRLRSVTIPKNVTDIIGNPFPICNSLSYIDVSVENPSFIQIDGVLYNKQQTRLIAYPGGREGAYTVPEGVTSIAHWAFYECVSLTSVDLPGSLISIDNVAFSNCSNLTSITIPENVKSIKAGAFLGCDNLTMVRIPKSVTEIGGGAFDACPMVMLIVEAGSYAEQYAQERNIPFAYSEDFLYEGDGDYSDGETEYYIDPIFVTATGNVKLRSGPGIDYDEVGILYKGDYLQYLDTVSTDDRGVDWYLVDCNGGERVWVSSMHSEIGY